MRLEAMIVGSQCFRRPTAQAGGSSGSDLDMSSCFCISPEGDTNDQRTGRPGFRSVAVRERRLGEIHGEDGQTGGANRDAPLCAIRFS